MYQVGDFGKADTIAVLCRGQSLSHVGEFSDFTYCYLVGQFTNALKSLSVHLDEKIIVQIINKSSPKVSKKLASAIGIVDIQCNFTGWKNRSLSIGRKKLYNRICKINPWAKIHLAPPGIRDVRPRDKDGFIKWCTTGLYAVDLAAFWKPKEILIYGLDFYSVPYWKKELIDVSWKKNRKRGSSMIYNFNAIVRRDPNISFKIFTHCKSVQKTDNLTVVCL